MLYREFGNTGKKVSLVGFGGMRFKDVDDRDACVEMVVEAAKSGINCFDTAPGYFGVKGEEVLGEGLRELKRLELPFFCSTKTFKSSSKQIRKEITKQLRRLDVDVIDFYHAWCVLSLESWEQRKTHGIIQTLRELKEEGLVRHLCVSSHLPGDEIKSLLDENVFEGVLFGYSAYNFPLRGPALDAVAARNLGCAVMNPLGGGLIPQNPKAFDYIKTREDQPIVEAALHFLFAHEQINTVLVGFGELQEIREAVQAVETYRDAPAPQIEELKARFSQSFQDLCTGCRYCDHCPEGVPVPKYMDAYNHKMLFGSDEALLRRLRKQWSLPAGWADRCTACGQCEEACTQYLPIVERLKEIAALSES